MTAPLLRPDELAPADEEAGLRLGAYATLAEVHDELLVFFKKRLADREAAADLTQEALLRMIKYSHVDGTEDRESLLFRIAHNLIREHRRTQYRRHADQHIPLDEIATIHADDSSVEELTDARQAIHRLVTRTIAELPPKCRAAFLLNRYDGLTHPQIAARMRISTRMVEKHITRALTACRLAVSGH